MNPIYIVVGLIVVVLIVLLVFFLIQRKKAKAAAAANAAAGNEPIGPGSDEISLLIHEADTKLAAAKQEAGARFSTLPVYLILGDAGCAKTSVMLNSGLDPELLAGQVYQNGNVTSTRTANIWFTRRAIFAEAGGKLPADAPKWKN